MTFGTNIQNTLESSLHVSVFMYVHLLFINFSSSRPDTETENNVNFDAVSSNSKCGNSDAISKEGTILKKNLNECKCYNARQFIREFPDKG